jgi:Carboxypeptidase regulatory-like domain/TonB dependent receptor
VKRLLWVMVAVFALALCAGASIAADTRLAMKGRVIDEDGLPVGNAQVRLEQAGGQVFLAKTDDAGYFSLLNLSPGEYKVRIEKAGFFLLADQKVVLSAETTEFAFTLNHVEEVREKVEVTVPPHQIEPATTQSTETLTTKEILDIPVPSGHNLEQSLILMPQVLRDNSNLLHIAGARNTQVQYLLDGVEVGDPASNGLTSRMVVEAVRNTEIQTGRFGAEYAHPGGAILNYETREGDDRWRFNATDFIPGINVQEGVQLGNFYPRVTFSGPIIKDELWFSQAFDVLHTLSIEKGLPEGVPNQSQHWGGDSWSRMLWKMSTNNSLHIGFLANVDDDANFGLDALHPQPVTTDRTARELFGFVKAQSYFEKNLFEIGIGAEDSLSEAVPQGTEPYILLVNGATGNYFQKSLQDARRFQLFSDAIRGPVKWHGTHTISVGVNVAEVSLEQDATRGEIQALRADLTLDRQSTFTGNPNLRVGNTQAGGFVQDSWSPNEHFVILAGVRVDWDRAVHGGLVQPRLAANWMPFKDNRAKFSVGWGMYDIPLNLSVIGQASDQKQVDTLYDATGKIVVDGPATSAFLLPAGGLEQLKQPYFDIASVGWQERFGEGTIVGVELLARDQHNGTVWQTVTPGQLGSEFLLRSTRQDKYRGVTITARHTFKNSAVLFGSYTRSRANTDQVLDPILGALYFAPQQPGPLSWDAPNRVMTWGSIPTPFWGILFSYLVDYHTGYPYSAINQQQFLVGAANSLRFPEYESVSIAFEKKFTLKERVFAARVAVINLFNSQNPDVVYNNVDAPNYGLFTGGQGRAITARLRFVGRR